VGEFSSLQSCDDCRCEKGEGSLRNDIGDIGDVVRQHSRAEECLHALLARSMVSVVATAMLLQSIDRELFVACVQPLCSSWEIWKTKYHSRHGDYSDKALDDEKPAETFQPTVAVCMADAVRNRTAKCSGEITERSDQTDADCSLIVSVPAGLFLV